MLIPFRILFGACMIYVVKQLWRNGMTNLETGDIMNAYYTAAGVIAAIANAVVWAPYIGEKFSDPITGTITRGNYIAENNLLLRLIHWAQKHGWKRLTTWFCFLEGVNHPHRPAAFVVGLRNARPGSWLEKVYAREVMKFENTQNCVQAWQTLKRHGVEPETHHNTEVQMVLMSLERETKPPPAKVAVPTAPPTPPLKRNPQIQLFEKPEASSSPTASGSQESLEIGG